MKMSKRFNSGDRVVVIGDLYSALAGKRLTIDGLERGYPGFYLADDDDGVGYSVHISDLRLVSPLEQLIEAIDEI